MLTAALFQACLDVFKGCLFYKSYAWLMETYLLRYSFKLLITKGSAHSGLSGTFSSMRLLPLLSWGTWTTWVWAQKSQCAGFSLLCLGKQTTVMDQSSGPCRNFSATKTFGLPHIVPNTKNNRETAWAFLALYSYILKPNFCLLSEKRSL